MRYLTITVENGWGQGGYTTQQTMISSVSATSLHPTCMVCTPNRVEAEALSEWHGALGYAPHTFSTKGIVGALPVSYGRLLCA